MSQEGENDEPPVKMKKIDVQIRITPILDPKYTDVAVASTSFCALALREKRLIGVILKDLPELPEHLGHLKRVGKDGRVLLCRDEDEVKEKLLKKLEFNHNQQFDVELVQVPSLKPRTRIQFENAKLVWPTAFHPDHALEALLSGKLFENEAIKSQIFSWSELAEQIGCIVVRESEIIAKSSSRNKPLRHSVMEMVRKVAESQSEDEYLGTGCDVFLRNEPCGMCAMALVHFRSARVFFNHPSKNGVLSPNGWQLHLEPSLNHHYSVFRIDCEAFSQGFDICC
ncbi:unnamed protein product [Caenorhabditis auriculariae]|uniref:CMP/dCMP-type deaminase domain-containing protein n=1 Tax=Caenorhabditis auriculariae TaxID=2777116 RepID=A0A8S1HKV7_9PELO|nr:unnamed protein product [Caenorhabditis auriculariae]